VSACPFQSRKGLDDVWGYTPSIDNMRRLLDLFAWDRNLVNDELARLRYEASIRPGFQESFAAMFPAPRQRWVDAMASREADIRAIAARDPGDARSRRSGDSAANSLTLAQWIPSAQLHVFGQMRPLDPDRAHGTFQPTGRQLPCRMNFRKCYPWTRT
jgi:2-hydroxymuconate-semialdehyde hydrolase